MFEDTSVYVVGELDDASEPKKSSMIALIDTYGIQIFPATSKAEQLANIYIAEGVIPVKFPMDGLNIATASINGLYYLLSLNFSHINITKTKEMKSK
jgi:hypothetical protein